MRLIARWIGIWLLAAAFVALVVDGVRWLADMTFQMTSLGEFWFWASRSGLNLTQAIIERYTVPFFWDPVMITILQLPIWVVAGTVGLSLCFVGRRWAPMG